jgi:hypothetical protein
MHPCSLISQALQHEGVPLPELPSNSINAVCAVTGQQTACLPRKDVLGKSFTNGDLLAVPGSEYVSVDVFYAWNYGYLTAPKPLTEPLEKKLLTQGVRHTPLNLWKAVEAQGFCTEASFRDGLGTWTEELETILNVTQKKITKKPERMSSWFCDGQTFQELDRIGVREMMFREELPSNWAAYATTSYKKHGSLLAKVNTGSHRFWLFEERQVDCSDMVQVRDWWKVLNGALRNGIGRTVLESLDCPPYLMRTVGLSTWMAFELWAKDKYLSALYAFLCYLLPSQEELKHEFPKSSV